MPETRDQQEISASQPEEQSELPTAEELKKQADELIRSAERARRQQQLDIKKKADDVETLYQQQRQDEELLAGAQKTLEYFEAQQNLELLDDDGKVTFKKFQATVEAIRKHQAALNEKIEQLTDRPEVMANIQERAIKEDEEKEETNKHQAELEKQNEEVMSVVSAQFEALKKEVNEELDRLEAKINSDEFKQEIASLKAEYKRCLVARLNRDKHRAEAADIEKEIKGIKDGIRIEVHRLARKAHNFAFNQEGVYGSEEPSLRNVLISLLRSEQKRKDMGLRRDKLMKEIKKFRDGVFKRMHRLYELL